MNHQPPPCPVPCRAWTGARNRRRGRGLRARTGRTDRPGTSGRSVCCGGSVVINGYYNFKATDGSCTNGKLTYAEAASTPSWLTYRDQDRPSNWLSSVAIRDGWVINHGEEILGQDVRRPDRGDLETMIQLDDGRKRPETLKKSWFIDDSVGG